MQLLHKEGGIFQRWSCGIGADISHTGSKNSLDVRALWFWGIVEAVGVQCAKLRTRFFNSS